MVRQRCTVTEIERVAKHFRWRLRNRTIVFLHIVPSIKRLR